MDTSETNMGRPSSVGPTKSSASTSPRSNTPLARNRNGVDQTLLQPVVRSRRTPVACTECRRRQVKCSGGTPRCERCEKRNMHCEYIPLHQQRVSTPTAGNVVAPILQSRATWPGIMNASGSLNRSMQPSPGQWQQASHYQGYVSPAPHGQQDEWQTPYAMSAQMSSIRRCSQHSAHSAPAYGNTSFNQSYISNAPATPEASLAMQPTYGQNVPAQYAGGLSYDMYGQTGTSGGIVATDPAYSHNVAVHQRRRSEQVPVPPAQHESYQERYYQGSPEIYDATVGSVHVASGDWINPTPTYPGYGGPSYQ